MKKTLKLVKELQIMLGSPNIKIIFNSNPGTNLGHLGKVIDMDKHLFYFNSIRELNKNLRKLIME